MTITLADDLEKDLIRRAEELGIPPEELARRAVARYLWLDPELEAEMLGWQRMTWNAWAKVEESLQ